MKDFFAALFLIIAIVAAIIFAVNFSNEKIDGGFAGLCLFRTNIWFEGI